ncbi:hypothetical protein MPSEU_000114600 [Mayamaea pseudoterrestris]|nr:hypothetical protein MPSEU_000114600 [Mayamaea pseudoterrestris]
MQIMSDPNNWVKNPPSTFVVIQNTSREALNNQMGIVVGFQSDRYIIALTKTPRMEPKSFKSDNLRVASKIEQFKAQYELLTNDPNVQAQIQSALQQVKQVTGLDAQYLAGLLVALLIASLWLLGISRTLMLISFLAMTGMVLVPAYLETKSLRGALTKAPDQLAKVLRESNLPLATRIASNKMYMAMLVGFFVAFFVSAMLPKSVATAAVASGAGHQRSLTSWITGTSSPSASTTASSISAVDLEKYYKLGFDDATEQKAFGTSLPEAAASATSMPIKPSGPHRVDHDEFDYASSSSDSTYSTMPKMKSKSSLFSISNAMCVFAIFRTVNELGRDGPNGQIDLRRLWANIQVQPFWRLGLLGLSVYRLVSSVLASY